jgi:hypothetical protein
MEDGLFIGGIILLLLTVITVNFLQIVKDFFKWYRITTSVAFKTNVTVAELQRMLASRRLHTATPESWVQGYGK